MGAITHGPSAATSSTSLPRPISPTSHGMAGPAGKEAAMLDRSGVATRLPAQDLARARAFYAEKLGLEPAEERPGGLLYRCGQSEFVLFQSEGAPSGSHTQMAWQVDDIAAAVAQLKARGVVFEDYDVP